MFYFLLFFTLLLKLINVMSVPIKNSVPFPNRVITWSILNDSMMVSPGEVRGAFMYAFDQWSAQIPRDFLESPKNSSANIRISFETEDHGDGKPFPPGFSSQVYSHSDANGTIHFNDDIVWYKYEEGRVNSLQNNFVDITWFAMYRIGIVLGMKESSNRSCVMFPRYPNYNEELNRNYRLPTLSESDITDIQKIYGRR